MAKFGKTISIRWSLLRSFVVLILLSSLTVLLLMAIRARQTEKELSEKLINRGTLQATQELDRFFQPVNINALIAARWGLAGKLNLAQIVAGPPGKLTPKQIEAVTRLNTLLAPLMALFPDMSSLQVANARGDGFLIIRLENGRIRNRVVSRQTWGTQTLWFDVDQEGRPEALGGAGSPEWATESSVPGVLRPTVRERVRVDRAHPRTSGERTQAHPLHPAGSHGYYPAALARRAASRIMAAKP